MVLTDNHQNPVVLTKEQIDDEDIVQIYKIKKGISRPEIKDISHLSPIAKGYFAMKLLVIQKKIGI